MATPNTLIGDLIVTGNISAKTMTPAANSVNDASVQTPSSGSNAVSALKIQSMPRIRYAQPNTTATTETRVLHRVYGGTAKVSAFHIGSIGATVGSDTVTADLQKNGTTILTGVVTLTSATAAYGSVSASLAAGALSLVAGDVLTVILTATHSSGTLPTGVFVEAVLIEDPS